MSSLRRTALLVSLWFLPVLSASPSDWLYEQWGATSGKECATKSQKFRVWLDRRTLRETGKLSVLLSNEGPGDAFVSQHVFWYVRNPNDARETAVSVPGPGGYVLLGPAEGRRKLTSTAVFSANPLVRGELAKVKPLSQLIIVFEIIDRSDGISHRMEVECD